MSQVDSQKGLKEVFKNDDGNIERNPNNTYVECSDDRIAEISAQKVKLCPFLATSEGSGSISFKYPFPVLENLIMWCDHYTAKGKPKSALSRPCVYRDFSYVATNNWDKEYFFKNLWAMSNRKYYLMTMNAAEEFGMDGLLDFLCIGFGCIMRSGTASSVIQEVMNIPKSEEITDEELKAVTVDYPWLAELTAPTNRR